jgi:glycosyltransferase involved in cell wall biosynthesis
MPNVSVICPVYNAAAFVEPTLQSVLNQTYKDFELIVVNDGSTDNTRQILEKYGDKIRYVYKKNGGQSSSRNAGIRVARGQYIALIDHDDIWIPNKLELQVQEMEKAKTIGLVTCGTIGFNENGETGRTLRHLVNSLTRTQLLRRLAMGNIIGGCSNVLIRNECFLKLGLFDESLRMAEDWDMWVRIAQSYDIRSIPQLLVKYRWHEKNFSNSSAEVNLTNESVFLTKIFSNDFFRNKRLLKHQAFSRRYLAAAIAYRESHDQSCVRHCLLKAIAHYPPIVFRKTTLALVWFVCMR